MVYDGFLAVRTAVESGILAWGFSNILQKKVPLWMVQIAFFVTFYSCNILGDVLLGSLLQVPYVAKVPLVLCSMFLAVHLCFEGKAARKLFVLLIVYLGMFMMDITLSLCLILGAGRTLANVSSYTEHPTILLVIFYSMLTIYLKYLPLLLEGHSLQGKQRKSFLLIPVCQIVMLFGVVCCATITQDYRVYIILLCCTLLTCFCAFFLFRSMEMVAQSIQTQEQERHMEQKAKMQRAFYDVVAQKVQELKMQQHDMANHIQTIKALLNQKDSQQVEQYVSQLEENFERSRARYFCKNVVVNSVLFCKEQQAKQMQIDFRARLQLDEGMPFEASQISSLLSNLLDNAIEGCARVEKNRFIEVSDHLAGSLYTLKVVNSKSSQPVQMQGGSILTSKDYASDHGYGTRIVQKIAQKYGGEVQFVDEGDRFSAIVLLQAGAAQE